MLSFRSVLVAVAAFATTASAIPTAAPSPRIPSLNSLPGAPAPPTDRAPPAGEDLTKRGQSCGVYYNTCSEGVTAIIVEISLLK